MFFRFNIKPKIPIKNKNNDKFIVLSYYKPFGTCIKCLIFIIKYYLLITKINLFCLAGFKLREIFYKGVRNLK